MYTHIYESLCCTEEINMLFNQLYTSILKKGWWTQSKAVCQISGQSSFSFLAKSQIQPGPRCQRPCREAGVAEVGAGPSLSTNTVGQRTPAMALMVSAILQWDHHSGSNVSFLSASTTRKVFV